MDITESVRETPLPVDFVIGFAYPNPFNAQITFEFVVTRDLPVRLDVFDLLGRHVTTLAKGKYKLGIHRLTWHARNQSSGIYLARLSSSQSHQKPWTIKLILLK